MLMICHYQKLMTYILIVIDILESGIFEKLGTYKRDKYVVSFNKLRYSKGGKCCR